MNAPTRNETDLLQLSCATLPIPCDVDSLGEADRFLQAIAESIGPEEVELDLATHLFRSLLQIAHFALDGGGFGVEERLDLVSTLNEGLEVINAVLNRAPGSQQNLQQVVDQASSRWSDCLALVAEGEADDAWEFPVVDGERPELEAETLGEPSADEVNNILAALGGSPVTVAPPIAEPAHQVAKAVPPGRAKVVEPVAPVMIDDQEFAEAFLDDACRCLASMEEALLAYEGDGNRQSLDQLCRELHTLKGAAGSVGLMKLGEYLHGVEDDVRLCFTQDSPLDTDMVLACVDAVRQQIATLQGATVSTSETSLGQHAASLTPPPSSTIDDAPSSAEPSLRVKASQIDRLMDMLAELVMLRNQRESRVEGMKSMHTELAACAARARTIDSQQRSHASETRIDERTQPGQHSGSIVEVADDLREIARGLREHYEPVSAENELISRFIRQFRQELVDLRRVPVSGLFRRLQRSVRDAAKAEGKQVRLEFVGEQAGIDRSLQESLYEPLLHIVRNAVSHGIEQAEDRVSAGKEPTGTVTLEATGGANFMVIEVRDNGKGLDYDALRRRGVDLGFLRNDLPSSREELAQLIFRPGFSTRTTVTEVSGRGVGMDVVATALQKMRSWVEVESEPGAGTRIRLTIPLGSVIEHAMVFRTQGQLYAVPMRFVHSAGASGNTGPCSNIVSFSDLIGRANSTSPSAMLVIGYGGRPVSAGSIGQQADAGGQAQGRHISLLVDDIVGPEEVVLRPLPQLLKQHRLYSGVTLAGSGEIVLVFDTQQLVELGIQQSSSEPDLDRAVTAGDAPAASWRPPRRNALSALVVDDSLTARRSMRRALEDRGMRVVDVADGHEALQQLQHNAFDLVVSDLEMPRLDGLGLLARLRSDESLAGLPFIIASSRDDEPFQARARELNAMAYLKKPVSAETLEATLNENSKFQAAAKAHEEEIHN